MELVEALSIALPLLSGCTATIIPIVTAIVALRELRQWRAEALGRRKIELARDIGFLAVKFRETFQRARNPFTFSHETEAARTENPDKSEHYIRGWARLRKLDTLYDLLDELEQKMWEAEVILEEELQEYFIAYAQALHKLSIAINEEYFDEPMAREGKAADRLKIIYSVGEDDLAQSMRTNTTKLKQVLSKYVR